MRELGLQSTFLACLAIVSSFLRSGLSTLTVTSLGVTPSTLICRRSRPASLWAWTIASFHR